jgi:CubicO group peptidase (beta-lactamase class C family)
VIPLVVLVLLTAAVARTGLPPVWVPWAHRAVTATMAAQKIPGLSVAVVSGGVLRWSSGYGLADVENQVPARADTAYRWGSVSKPVTAVAVMQLVDRGKLDLDATIQTYVPTFPEKPWPITCRQLLAHLGGIRHYHGDERASVRHYTHFRDAFDVFQNDPLVCEPGTRHVYTTYGYNLLGAAVEEASGRPFIGYVHENIFRPAGMTNTRAGDLEPIIAHRARGYVKPRDGALRNARPADMSNRTPGGGLCGTAEDAARFAAAVMAGRLLPKSTLGVMFTPQKTRDGRPFDYGLGWSVSRHKGRDEVWHAGHTQGASTMLYMLPDRQFAVALLTNLEDAHLLDLAREIADAARP